ncbi:Cytosolic Fe-S cluster assembly factor NARFL [Tetrabaena socialis]|uniref:Cytosolic Fe-S cluster assembly factor NARFL n=1 Tax=Tetrabaena socialis TaxID=47790 RepID=A0A2J8A236_9CHLO|nr:Cytosolic Fe-S cluster assembly factor NARFL [Tetrabaena socialis]|eukprot:PNH06589.1 Cytosolic Fe-S cluster assembly factor NARFL [Tetrabaena socialis]
MEFSSTIRVADLNDYIAPSQDCVVALNGKLKVSEASEEVQLQPRAARGAAPGTSAPPSLGEAVKVSLHDCLACSGCITSAETVLLQQQSSDEFLAQLANPNVAVVVTVSPQSRASLAVHFGLSPTQTLVRLAGWFKALGVRAVWDLTTARDLVLLEEAAEFLLSTSGQDSAMDAEGSASGAPQPLPVMASSCPGWVCYAEKTQGSRVLPHLSTTRSPQGAMGGLVKSLVASAWGVAPASLYHVSVMPCYDKKLEASREELTTGPAAAMPEASSSQEGRIPEVDCCLTTGEVLQLLQQWPAPGCQLGGLADPSAPDCTPDPILPGVPADDRLYGTPYGSSSGGYADFVYRAAARELYGIEVPPGPLPWRSLRNADFQELTLGSPGTTSGGGQDLRFARVYGFRNIQTLLRQVKMGRCAYQYVEVMACPSGCLNGGGQIKPGPGTTPQQLVEQLEAMYAHTDVAARSPANNPAVVALYGGWLGGAPGAPLARELLHTTYREREKTVTTALVSNW